MTGTTLSDLNLGQNWSTMMVAATSLLPSLTEMIYTPDTTELTAQLLALLPASMPTAPDLSLLPERPDKSLLQLQYDLMLVHLIDVQMAADLAPLDQADLAAISAENLTNRNSVLQGFSGLTEAQKSALMNALSPMHLI